MKQYKFKKLIILVSILVVLGVAGFAFYHFTRTPHPASSNQGDSNPETVPETTPIPAQEASQTPTPNPPILKPKKPVAILMYHSIRVYNNSADKIGTGLSVPQSIFDTEMKALKDSGFQSISLSNYYSGKLPAKPVVISFDDGYDNAYTQAFPVLKKYGYIGIFYIITGKINTTGYLNDLQIKEMAGSGMIFGDHTISHPDLTNISNSKLTRELVESKSKLEHLVGSRITDFCYPSGKYNFRVEAAVRSAGFLTATTTKSPSSLKFSDFLRLPRLRISNTDTARSVLRRVLSIK